MAHEEMVVKSGGGINNLLENLDYSTYLLELSNQKICRLNKEINDLELKLVEMAVTYKFKNCFFVLEINKLRFYDKIKDYRLYILYNKCKKSIYFKFSFFKTFKLFVVILNLLFLINNINKII